MDSILRTSTIFLSCLGVGLIAFGVSVNFFIYRRNVKRLNACINSEIIKPPKGRFAFSWFFYCLLVYVPGLLFLWLLEQEFPYNFAWLMLILLMSSAPAAYPYYHVAISSDKINGATRWGWLWERIDIRLNEIDKDDFFRPHLGKKLGIIVVRSTRGTKILTLGLSDQQVGEIMKSANKTDE